jgi:predicted anti-sigma-YlaC factor YlaD
LDAAGHLSCARFTELVGEHVEGALSVEMRSAMGAHLGGCSRCRALLDEYARVGEVVRRATDVRMPLGARARLSRALARLWHHR